MSKTITQPTINPTRKLTSAVIATALLEVGRVLSSHYMPGVFDPAFWMAVSPIAVFGVGYFVKDEPNVTFDFQGEHA